MLYERDRRKRKIERERERECVSATNRKQEAHYMTFFMSMKTTTTTIKKHRYCAATNIGISNSRNVFFLVEYVNIAYKWFGDCLSMLFFRVCGVYELENDLRKWSLLILFDSFFQALFFSFSLFFTEGGKRNFYSRKNSFYS